MSSVKTETEPGLAPPATKPSSIGDVPCGSKSCGRPISLQDLSSGGVVYTKMDGRRTLVHRSCYEKALEYRSKQHREGGLI